ncbi:MAG TPA: hypothetical protein VGG16_30345 [Streptosporangiaceae bacterium]
MGWKTAILLACDGNPALCLGAADGADPAATADLMARAYPGWTATPTEGEFLHDATFPPEGIAYAGSFPAADIICDQEFMLEHPSQLSPNLVALGEGRRLVLHTMHSVVDFFAFGVWEDGTLVRSLSMALGGPRPGIMENLGTPLPFEEPYWAGQHAIADGYPLPFYPADLAEPTATAALFGFTLGGLSRSSEIEADCIALAGFTVPASEPVTAEQVAEFTQTHKRNTYRLVDGKLVEIDE